MVRDSLKQLAKHKSEPQYYEPKEMAETAHFPFIDAHLSAAALGSKP